MNRFTKTSLFAGIVLLVYGYLCRFLNIYFFWDSRSFGWIVLFIALLGFLFSIQKLRKLQGKKTIWVRIGICILILGLIILPGIVFIFKTSDAYQSAIEYLKTDTQIKKSFGNIKGFGVIPVGEMQITTINGAESGSAIFNITVKGDKKYKDINIALKKTPETLWTVIGIE